nr:MAG TPA: hypothetical protein [Bacteriophage sp.]
MGRSRPHAPQEQGALLPALCIPGPIQDYILQFVMQGVTHPCTPRSLFYVKESPAQQSWATKKHIQGGPNCSRSW